jgi:maltose/moltooligosaccharide transporter
VFYTVWKVREYPPQLYAEYHGVQKEDTHERPNLWQLLVKAPSAFWTVGLVQFFCWAAFLFMWTYTNGSIAYNAFDTPTLTTVTEGVSRTLLDTTSKEYNQASDWVGVLFAVQAIGSMLWAVVIPMFRNHRLVYALSLVLGGIGFVSTNFLHDPYALFISYLLIGCAWAAMLALPFTILTNSLTGSHMGTYLRLFNGTICIPQIVAASVGGLILKTFTPEGALAPENYMLVLAGILLFAGAACVAFIKEKKGHA